MSKRGQLDVSSFGVDDDGAIIEVDDDVASTAFPSSFFLFLLLLPMM